MVYLKRLMYREGCQFSPADYGAMIKAYGQAHDIQQVWATWRRMSKQHIMPTEITLGCMVEALVKNRRAEDAYQLVQEIWAENHQRQLINTVTYTTLLKGFQKQPARALAL